MTVTTSMPRGRRDIRCVGRFVGALCTVAIALGVGAQAQARTAECRGTQKPHEVAELMFGRMIGNRVAVSETQWRRFVDREITSRFPDGLSVLDMRGQWREKNRIMREPSKLVRIVMPGRPEDIDRLNEIAEVYKKQFRQQSVIVIVSGACASF